MTGPDGGFLSRWSRLKEDARRKGDGPSATAVDARLAGVPAEEAAGEGAPHVTEEEVPLADLPPVDTIDANTDLTPWLRRRVPELWRRAALRRLWAADPAIRDFVGPADYAWDWNTPGGAPGYGPLRATDDIARLLAQATGTSARRDGAAPSQSRRTEEGQADACPETRRDVEPSGCDAAQVPAAKDRQDDHRPVDNFPLDVTDEGRPRSCAAKATGADTESSLDIALQQYTRSGREQPTAASPSRRRGGRATPR